MIEQPKKEEKNLDSSLIMKFLDECDISSASKTIYQNALKQFFSYLEQEQINHPTRSDLLKYREVFFSTHSAKTVNLHLSVLRNFFEWTQFYGIYTNIAFNIKDVRASREAKRQALTSVQVKSILESIDCSTLCGCQKYALVLLCSTTGLRAGEISSLNISDLKTVQDNSVLTIKGKGYQNKDQMVKIGSKTDQAIRAALALRSNFSLEDPLFISTSNYGFGSRITPKGIGKILKKILEDNNFVGSFYTGHSFRHTACCLGLEVSERDLVSIRRFMRHQNLETTLIYADHEEFLAQNIAQDIEDKLVTDE